MTSKKDLIEFTRSFPGADAQIMGRMTNSYITSDTIEYKTITIQESAKPQLLLPHGDIHITNHHKTLNVTGSINVSQDIKCQTANINNVFAIDMRSGYIATTFIVSNEIIATELVKTKVLIADDISVTGILCEVIRSTGVICEGILMGTNEITYTDNNLNISGNLNVAGDIHSHKKLSGNTLTVDTSIHANSISTTMSATFGKDLHVGNHAIINGSLTTPNMTLSNIYLVAEKKYIELDIEMKYDLTNKSTNTPLKIGDRIYIVGLGSHSNVSSHKGYSFRGTLELTGIFFSQTFIATLSMVIFDKDVDNHMITTYGEVITTPVLNTDGSIASLGIIGKNAITGGTGIYQGLNGIMDLITELENNGKKVSKMLIDGTSINGNKKLL
jgi:hypothetical protein